MSTHRRWLMTRSAKLLHTLLAAKEQIAISGSVIDEEIARQILAQKAALLPPILADIKVRRQMVVDWLAKHEDIFECVVPQGGVVCFPRIRDCVTIDTGLFYKALIEETGTLVGPGHWFEQSDRSFRLGFGWYTHEALAAGLQHLSDTVRKVSGCA